MPLALRQQLDHLAQGSSVERGVNVPGLRTARHRQDPRALRPGPPPGGSRTLRTLRSGLPPGAGTPRRQARSGPAPPTAQAGQLRLPAPGRRGLPAPGGRRVRGPLNTHRRTLRAPVVGHHVKPGLLGVGTHLRNPMATAAAIDRVVHHSVILEFDVPSYRTDAAQQRAMPRR